jgi:uncharacterized protein (TIGR00645 family)
LRSINRTALESLSSSGQTLAAHRKDITMIERFIETILFNSRWLLAPFYLGLVAALLMLLVAFVVKSVKFVIMVTSNTIGLFSGGVGPTENEVILGVLSLIDLTLAASLVIIVIFSGYENFVSKLEEDTHRDWPEWMGKIDFTGLKLKLLSSIVAISAIQLLKVFMEPQKASDRELYWYVVIHVVFVASGILLAATDWIAEAGSKKGKKSE